MKYKIIFSDIDGTIINSQHVMSDKTKEVLMKLDIPVVLVSARMPQGIHTIQQQFDNQDPIICYSGALVLDNQNILYDAGIDKDEADGIYKELIQCQDVSVSTYCYDHWYCQNYDEWVKQEEQITSLKAQVGYFDNEKKVHKFLCMAKSDDIDRLEAKMKKLYPHLAIYKSKSTYLEIMSGKTSKLEAIKVLLKHYHISIEDSLSFGDNYNDLDMLQNTGMSFAMANAPEQIKKQIGRVTASNDEDGIVYAIKNLI